MSSGKWSLHARTLFDLNIKDVSQCVMPGVKKSNDVELQLHESDATDQTEVSTLTLRCEDSRRPSPVEIGYGLRGK